MSKRRTWIGVAVTVLVAGALLAWSPRAWGPTEKNGKEERPEGETLIYEKREGWGPCPDESGCFLNTYVFSSGRVVYESEDSYEIRISEQAVGALVRKVRESGLMTNACPAPEIVDYWATTKIAVDGVAKEIRYPGCEKELADIEALIPSYDRSRAGGA